jgi:hypothetical protein
MVPSPVLGLEVDLFCAFPLLLVLLLFNNLRVCAHHSNCHGGAPARSGAFQPSNLFALFISEGR